MAPTLAASGARPTGASAARAPHGPLPPFSARRATSRAFRHAFCSALSTLSDSDNPTRQPCASLVRMTQYLFGGVPEQIPFLKQEREKLSRPRATSLRASHLLATSRAVAALAQAVDDEDEEEDEVEIALPAETSTVNLASVREPPKPKPKPPTPAQARQAALAALTPAAREAHHCDKRIAKYRAKLALFTNRRKGSYYEPMDDYDMEKAARYDSFYRDWTMEQEEAMAAETRAKDERAEKRYERLLRKELGEEAPPRKVGRKGRKGKRGQWKKGGKKGKGGR